jgi:hypothetical protein
VGQREMNAGEHPVIGMADVLNSTGAFTMEIPCPRSRSTATIRVEMRDETRLLFVDEFRWGSCGWGRRSWAAAASGNGLRKVLGQQAHTHSCVLHLGTHPSTRVVPPRLPATPPRSLSFHIHFYRLLKWLIAGPFLAAALALLAFRADTDALPA